MRSSISYGSCRMALTPLASLCESIVDVSEQKTRTRQEKMGYQRATNETCSLATMGMGMARLITDGAAGGSHGVVARGILSLASNPRSRHPPPPSFHRPSNMLESCPTSSATNDNRLHWLLALLALLAPSEARLPLPVLPCSPHL